MPEGVVMEDLDEMLIVCLERVKGDALSFIESLADQFERTGRLSDKQRAALERFYENCRERDRR